MSIDSVGGGSKDPAYQIRRRAIEEERNRELDKLEAHHKEAVEGAQELREKALKQIYENQTLEVAGRQREADERVAQAKAAADARIRDFEAESVKMTEGAKRQFQTKAEQLAKNARELDVQRQYMLKQHTDSMKNMATQQEQAEHERRAKYDRETNKAYLAAQGELKKVEELGRRELEQTHIEQRDQKRAVAAESQRELEHLLDERERNTNSIDAQIKFNKRTGEEQLARTRDELERSRSHQQLEYESRMSDLNRENSGIISRTHLKGQKKVKEAADLYAEQLDQLRKENTQKTHDITDRSTLAMQTLEANARSQEQLAKAGYTIKQGIVEERRNKIPEDGHDRNAKLQAKVNADYSKQSKILADSRENLLKQQSDQIQSELKHQRDVSQRQLNSAVAAAAEKLIDHNTKSVDPFYRVHAFGAQLEDQPTHVTVRISVPEHEQDTVRLTLQQGKLTVSGSRRYEDRAKMEDGHTSTTNSYQSYSESFPVTGKLVMNKLTRDYANGVLTFRVPRG